ncbi:MAG TPA: O-antigen ligase family protein [Rhodopila sp.]|uniref:O-antigen ligase family protein n=1 Tax=Rhodopila sp. TaxID=2480087 RepID=UPI002C0FF791|nr:O-antigen ligase family protein [Rhodopila sp.]HVY17187.1 O-antigen ligase family protein [Rhodopila sp.]
MIAATGTRFIPRLEQTALVCVLLVPLLLMHAHGIAEVAIAIADVCFLLRSALLRDWDWLKARWLWFSAAWWIWLVVCSLPIPALHLGEGGLRSLVQAVTTVRFLVFVAAMEFLVLRSRPARRWMYGLIAASVAWIALNSVVQYAIGWNLIGWPPGPEGVLTGPFGKPRAGPPMALIIPPAVVPPVAALLSRKGLRPAVGAYALLAASLVLMVMIGQRMPLVLTVFAFVIVACLMRRLRPVVLTAAVVGGLMLAASPVLAPNAYYRLVDKFSNQLEHFAVSPYGQLYARAWEVGIRNPVTGMGFDGFETGCQRPQYFRPTFDGSQPDGGGAKICWHHPHNHYLQALDDGGFIGLLLFSAMGIAWLVPLARGLGRDSDPLRAGLFAVVCAQVWPIQSTSAFTSMPMGGWLFLLLGWGLAEARHRSR